MYRGDADEAPPFAHEDDKVDGAMLLILEVHLKSNIICYLLAGQLRQSRVRIDVRRCHYGAGECRDNAEYGAR